MAWMTLAVAAAAVPPRSLAADGVNEPIGYVRFVDGTARIRSDDGVRWAEPFSPLKAGDTLEVQSGTAAACDIRTGESFEVRAGSALTLPRSVVAPNPSLYQKLLRAVGALKAVPRQSSGAVVRDGARSTWPDQLSFGPGAAVSFRWTSTSAAASFDLIRLEPSRQVVVHIDRPASPTPWPKTAPRPPGRYLWEVRDAHGGRLASGQFTVMTDAEADRQRQRFSAEAAADFDAQQRSLIAELLAAQHGYIFN